MGWINSLAWVAATAAYRDGKTWLEELLGYLKENRDTLTDWLRGNFPQVNFTRPEGTYLAWLDMTSLNLKPNPYEFFLKEARVALNDGKTFGTGGEGFLRLNFATQRSVLQEALDRMKRAIEKYSSPL